MEIVKYTENQLAQETIEEISSIELAVKRLQDLQSQYKQELIDIMEQNGIDTIENETFRIKYVPEGESVVLDQNKLKNNMKECILNVKK